MKLARIYASKLYLTSTRRDRIDAAINSEYNVELVQQLSDYLDDDSKEVLTNIAKNKYEEKQAEQQASNENPDANESFNKDIPDDENVFSPSYSGAPSAEFMGEPNLFDMPEGEEGDMGDDMGSDNPFDGPDTPDDSVEESTAIYGKVTANTDIDDIVVDLAKESNIIKGTLNSREDTAGVQRIAIEDKELWIYYEDKVNIGDIMITVIEVLNGTNYTYLSFSRLARSNNAIVFDINLNNQEPVKPVQEVEEEK